MHSAVPPVLCCPHSTPLRHHPSPSPQSPPPSPAPAPCQIALTTTNSGTASTAFDVTGGGGREEDSDVLPYRPDFFHLVFLLASGKGGRAVGQRWRALMVQAVVVVVMVVVQLVLLLVLLGL